MSDRKPRMKRVRVKKCDMCGAPRTRVHRAACGHAVNLCPECYRDDLARNVALRACEACDKRRRT